MNDAEWLAARRRGVGSSDAASVALRRGEHGGVFGTPLRVYLDKQGLLPDKPTEEMLIGRLLEDDVAEAFRMRTGLEPSAPPERIYTSRHSPWMQASPDRLVGDGVLECKAVRTFEGWGEDGGDVVPAGYMVQVQHQLAVLGAGVGHLAALCGTSLRCYTIPRDEELISRLAAVERDFWRMVVARTPPEPDWSHPDTPALVRLLHQPQEAPQKDMPAWAASLLDEYQRLGKLSGQLKKDRDQLQARLAELLGGAPAGRFPDGRVLSQKVVKRRGYEVPESTYVRFTVKGEDGEDGN